MKLDVFVILAMLASTTFADIKDEAAAFIPSDWVMDSERVCVADFNSDGLKDIALCYYQVDPELGEIENRINRIMVLVSKRDGLKRVLDQGLPEGEEGEEGEDYGVPVNLDWSRGVLTVHQHRGIMHQWNQWQLVWDSQREAFWERVSAWGGLMGLGSSGGFDAATGIGYVEKIWDDVNVSAEYLTIYASPTSEAVDINGLDDERAWERCRTTDTFWINYGEKNWKGKDDAGLKVRSLYDDTRLYLFVDVSDDHYVRAVGESDVLNSDHLELWFDLFNWEEAAAQGYFPELWQRTKDRYVYQIAVAEDSKHQPFVLCWLPEERSGDSEYVPQIDAAFSETQGHWSAELAIDWQSLGSSEGFLEYVTLSVVFSDADSQNDSRQETLTGTSQVRWADPFTFGSLVTTEPQRIYWVVTEH